MLLVRGSRQRKQSMRGRGGGVRWLGVSCNNQRGNSSFVLHAPPHWRLMNRITRFYSEQEADSWPRPCLGPALASAASLGADVTQMESGKMARTATWGCCKAAHLYPYSYSCTLVMCLVLHWHCLCPAPCQPTQHHWHCILFAILHMTLRDIHTSPENWSRTFVYIYSYIHSPSWAAHYYYIWLCSERSKEAFWNIIYISDMPCRIISIY